MSPVKNAETNRTSNICCTSPTSPMAKLLTASAARARSRMSLRPNRSASAAQTGVIGELITIEAAITSPAHKAAFLGSGMPSSWI